MLLCSPIQPIKNLQLDYLVTLLYHLNQHLCLDQLQPHHNLQLDYLVTLLCHLNQHLCLQTFQTHHNLQLGYLVPLLCHLNQHLCSDNQLKPSRHSHLLVVSLDINKIIKGHSQIKDFSSSLSLRHNLIMNIESAILNYSSKI